MWPIERRVVAAHLAHPLGDPVGHGEQLPALVIEQQVIVAKVRTRDVPVEVLGLEIEGEHVGEQAVERARDVADGLRGQTGRGVQRRRTARLGFLDVHAVTS